MSKSAASGMQHSQHTPSVLVPSTIAQPLLQVSFVQVLVAQLSGTQQIPSVLVPSTIAQPLLQVSFVQVLAAQLSGTQHTPVVFVPVHHPPQPLGQGMPTQVLAAQAQVGTQPRETLPI